MATKEKPAPEANRGTGYDAAIDSRDHTRFQSQLEALLIGIAAYDAALLALLALILWGTI